MSTSGAGNDAVVRIRGLTKEYGHRRALDAVDLDVPGGVCFGLFGPNGSGKTTLFKILSGLIRATSGAITVAGHEIPKQAAQIRARLGVMLDLPLIPQDFTLGEGLRYMAELHQIAGAAERIEALVERVGLTWRIRDPLATFSRGMAQRASLACALLADPEILLLDEPFTGLDRQACQVVEEEIVALRDRGKTVLLVTHELDRGGRLADEVAVLDHGRLVFRGARGEWSADDLVAVYR